MKLTVTDKPVLHEGEPQQDWRWSRPRGQVDPAAQRRRAKMRAAADAYDTKSDQEQGDD
jgi:hypothetical protein